METFDRSLKYLLKHASADLLRFALAVDVEVERPVETGLPSRGREIDGGYRVRIAGDTRVAHVEFQRRHEPEREVAVNVAEAQIRLFRREDVTVVSVVWDLYGRRDDPVRSTRVLPYAEGSQSAYTRVNLRGMSWRELLAGGPSALWPLVALTGDGACDEAVRAARDAIGRRTDLSAARKADHLAVLWFVAEAEDVAVTAMKAYIRREDLMQSALYQEIFADGKLEGERLGKLEGERLGKQAEARAAVLDLCEVLAVEVTPARKARLEVLELEQLHALREHLKRARTWLDL